MKEYKRCCVGCGNEIVYSCYQSWWWANKNQSLCKRCSKKGHATSEETKKLISVKMAGKNLGCDNPWYGKHHSLNSIQKIKERRKTQKMTGGDREKMRMAAVKRIQKYGIHARNFNPNACSFIDKINLLVGTNFQHALNGGEVSLCGYFVDGYDKRNNVIFEYDEPSHHTPKYKHKDEIKQKYLLDSVKPALFVRYDEKNGRLYDAETKQNLPMGSYL